MSPSMPITIAAAPASAPASTASSATSSSGVYIPVHRRTPSHPVSPAAPESRRTLPIYTPAELMRLAQSPLAQQVSAAMHSALHGQEFAAAITLNKRQQRSREYMQRTTRPGELKDSNVVVVPAVAPRRRPGGRVAERSSSRRGGASKFIDAASWRGQATRQAMPLAV
ncbi:hypothetical protein B0H17DRAFT_1133665 [Mycena rosella]|uniref:Uncharacterized protein n=1 Tax=Mycena rosella TaxID=1033263 RepID=A0AAD7DHT6_MYCRO|nr:hypothetical protein B0H17DRAFT_1133665 [Mycena rosella]